MCLPHSPLHPEAPPCWRKLWCETSRRVADDWSSQGCLAAVSFDKTTHCQTSEVGLTHMQLVADAYEADINLEIDHGFKCMVYNAWPSYHMFLVLVVRAESLKLQCWVFFCYWNEMILHYVIFTFMDLHQIFSKHLPAFAQHMVMIKTLYTEALCFESHTCLFLDPVQTPVKSVSGMKQTRHWRFGVSSWKESVMVSLVQSLPHL